MDAFKGKWERTSAENYEELLKVSKAVFFTLLFIDPPPPPKKSLYIFPCFVFIVNFSSSWRFPSF